MSTRRNVLSYLVESAQRTPEAIAVLEDGTSYTYRELLQTSRELGSSLKARGACGHAVVVTFEKGFYCLATMFGALFAGGFYVPVDPTVPSQRLSSIVGSLEQPLVVTNGERIDAASEALPETDVLLVEDLLAQAAACEPVLGIPEQALDSDPTYVLFTSGSTGKPKGVAVSHRAVIDFIDEFVAIFGFTCDDRFANQAPFDFDVSVKDIYSTIATGGTLVIVPRKLFVAPAALVEYLDDNQVTVMTWAVAALCLISGFRALDIRPLASVKQVLFSGEVMPLRHLKQWMAALPAARFVNLYGPTEITCNCTYHILDRDRDYADGIPMGLTFPGREVFLVDEEGNLVNQPGGTGEVLVRGTSLALGYIGLPEQTAAVFKQNPTHNRFPDRVYCTGDLATLLPDDQLLYAGRKDNQIKHQGHRIELEELDAVFERLEGVERCRCAYDQKRQRLYAFYEGTAEADRMAEDARAYIPAAMIPNKITKVEGMPLTKNGKVDRKALLELAKTKRR